MKELGIGGGVVIYVENNSIDKTEQDVLLKGHEQLISILNIGIAKVIISLLLTELRANWSDYCLQGTKNIVMQNELNPCDMGTGIGERGNCSYWDRVPLNQIHHAYNL